MVEEMVIRVENFFCSIGFIKDFVEIVYVVGYGLSIVNNLYYVVYDCGVCFGRSGFVNVCVFFYMVNYLEVCGILK